jgi:hypothetical protein
LFAGQKNHWLVINAEDTSHGQFRQHFIGAFAPIFFCKKKFKPIM